MRDDQLGTECEYQAVEHVLTVERGFSYNPQTEPGQEGSWSKEEH